jgi:hypothetical protein
MLLMQANAWSQPPAATRVGKDEEREIAEQNHGSMLHFAKLTARTSASQANQ